MSYKNEYEFGNGERGDILAEGGSVKDFNSYIKITKIESDTATADASTLLESRFGSFKAGDIVLLHISATNGNNAENLGKYSICKITLISGDIFTFDKNIEEIFSGVNLNYDYAQMVSIPQFDCLKVDNATLTAPVYDPYKFTGGILAFMVRNDFILDGNIDLADIGLPVNRKNALRPRTLQEINGENDKAARAGEENFITADRFILNAGDGAAMIFAKNFSATENSRIGNVETVGRQACRGAADSKFKPSKITNIGGSTIFIDAENLQNFNFKILAKYRNAELKEGRGLARCYIASNTKLPYDEKLYSYDIISDSGRVRRLGIENFGEGKISALKNPALPMNNFADITAVYNEGFQLTYQNKTSSGLSYFHYNTLIIALNPSGEFRVARILGISDSVIFLDNAAPLNTCKIISIPEIGNLTIDRDFPAVDFFAVAVNDTFTLNSEIKLGKTPKFGNVQSWDLLNKPAAFILAKNIFFGENAKISGNAFICTKNLNTLAQVYGDCFIFN